MTNKTIDYYNSNASEYVAGTIDADFKEVQERFLAKLPSGAKILDFGCGSGRDSKYFVNKGYNVDAVDGSEELCKLAYELTGIKTRQMFFEELDAIEEYDGIWACASILHLPKVALRDVIKKMIAATKKGGFIYASFKWGDFEGFRNYRFYTDFTEELFKDFIKDEIDIEIDDLWISEDVRPDRYSEQWLNILLQKVR